MIQKIWKAYETKLFSFFFIDFNQVITALHGLSSQGQKQSIYRIRLFRNSKMKSCC